jgi:hypothetical protein
MSKKITALGCTVFASAAVCFVGGMELGRISFEKGSVLGIACVFAALALQHFKK